MGVPRPTGGKKSHSHRPGAGGRKLSAPSSGQEGFLKGVTRNAILNEVVRNKQALQKENERLGKAKKKKTRTQVLAAMDLQELQMEVRKDGMFLSVRRLMPACMTIFRYSCVLSASQWHAWDFQTRWRKLIELSKRREKESNMSVRRRRIRFLTKSWRDCK
jgi:hypothetical protein